jgi:hypothetical protein
MFPRFSLRKQLCVPILKYKDEKERELFRETAFAGASREPSVFIGNILGGNILDPM